MPAGTFTINGDTVQLDEVVTSEIEYSATYGGEPMMSTNKVAEFAPLFLPPSRNSEFRCNSKH